MNSSATIPSALDCMHCGLCMQSCPTYRITAKETDSPRGRLALIRAAEEGRIEGRAIADSLNRCVQCRACEPVCPSAVPYHKLLTAQKEKIANPKQSKLLAFFLGSRFWLQRIGGLARFSRRSGILGLTEKFGPPTLRRLAAAVPKHPRALKKLSQENFPASGEKRGRVSLHLGCVDPQFFGEVLNHTIAVLNAEGFDVWVPPQPSCCGAVEAHASSSCAGEARGIKTLNSLGNTDAILVPAAGCAAFLQELSSQANQVMDPLAFLATQGLRTHLHPVPKSIVFDPPCHQQNILHSEKLTMGLLQQIPQLKIKLSLDAELCCGAGGISFLKESELPAALGLRKVEFLLQIAPEAVVTGNSGCRLQIESALRQRGSSIPVIHPISLLHRSIFGLC